MQFNKIITDHPLADLAGKFGDKLWEEILSEIERSRKIDKEELQKISEL